MRTEISELSRRKWSSASALKINLVTLLAVAFSCAPAGHSSAVSTPVIIANDMNTSFDRQPVAAGGTSSAVPGWTTVTGVAKTYNPPSFIFYDPVPDGTNVLQLCGLPSGYSEVRQQIGPLKDNSRYDLAVRCGK